MTSRRTKPTQQDYDRVVKEKKQLEKDLADCRKEKAALERSYDEMAKTNGVLLETKAIFVSEDAPEGITKIDVISTDLAREQFRQNELFTRVVGMMGGAEVLGMISANPQAIRSAQVFAEQWARNLMDGWIAFYVSSNRKNEPEIQKLAEITGGLTSGLILLATDPKHGGDKGESLRAALGRYSQHFKQVVTIIQGARYGGRVPNKGKNLFVELLIHEREEADCTWKEAIEAITSGYEAGEYEHLFAFPPDRDGFTEALSFAEHPDKGEGAARNMVRRYKERLITSYET